MIYLLDTCVLSEVRHPNGDGDVKAAISKINDNDLRISALTIGEIAKGIGALSESKRRTELENWLAKVETFYADRIIPIEKETAHIWGKITAEAKQKGEIIPVIDGLISATAIQHGFTIVIRNRKYFEVLGVNVFDPWS